MVLITSDYGVREVGVTVCRVQHVLWVLGIWVRPRICHFPYNENPKRALNTISFKCSLPSTDTIDKQEKIHVCIWRFKVASCKHALLESTRFPQKQKKSDTFLSNVYIHSSIKHVLGNGTTHHFLLQDRTSMLGTWDLASTNTQAPVLSMPDQSWWQCEWPPVPVPS